MGRAMTPQEIKNIVNRERNAIINSAAQKFAPQVYASMIITLVDYYGWNFEELKTLLEYNEEVWNRCYREDVKMIKKCSEEYGIDIIQLVGGNAEGDGINFRWEE